MHIIVKFSSFKYMGMECNWINLFLFCYDQKNGCEHIFQCVSFYNHLSIRNLVLWQPLITKTNDHTSSKSLRLDIKWEVHKRTRQEVSAKLESYIYKVHMVHATTSCPSHFLLKATMLYTCALMSSSRSFHHVLGLWNHTMWPVMWLRCHMSLYCPKEKKKKKKKINIKSEK